MLTNQSMYQLMHLSTNLLQENNPIEYFSRAFSPTELNYAHIEKEMLAIVFGCARFHQYIFRKKVVVHSDQKPSEAMFKKPITFSYAHRR